MLIFLGHLCLHQCHPLCRSQQFSLRPFFKVSHKTCKRKPPRQGLSVMLHHYKQPDVCQPFKTTRDYDKRRLSCLSPRAGWALNCINSASGGITTGGWFASSSAGSAMLSSATHQHTHVKNWKKVGPQQRPPKKESPHTMALFESHNEHYFWFSRHTKVHARCSTYGGCSPLRRGTHNPVYAC